ncbi:MAG: hypothetical protein ACI9O6_001071 [Glaciecola sp.]|jgi:hypothetical protein
MTDKKSKRKPLKPSKALVLPSAEVQQLHVESMVLSLPGGVKCYFKRLKYKGCPVLSARTLDFYPDVDLIDMKRDAFIRTCYQVMERAINETTRTYFHSVSDFLTWADNTRQQVVDGDYLNMSLIMSYMAWCQAQVSLGKMKKSTFSQRKKGLSWLLRQLGRKHDASKLPSVKGERLEAKSHQALDLETELKAVAKALFRAYRGLLKHVGTNTLPERHPLYDEVLVKREVERLGLAEKNFGGYKAAFKSCFTRAHPNNHIVRVAMMITFMFTGMNSTPLYEMRISDVRFKAVQGGKYIFDSVKGRANFQKQDNSLGFSTYAKQFMESWQNVALQMAKGNRESLLFPYYTQSGEAVSYRETQKEPQQNVNKLLNKMGLPQISSSKFRKTKSDVVYRATESVYLVAMMNNNEVKTTARTYVNGTAKEHENNLGAAMSAQHAIAKGKDVREAVDAAKFQFADILDDYDYQRLRKGQDRSHESRTLTGVRCNDNRKGAAQTIDRILKREGVDAPAEEKVCTDFLDCFECSEHAFVTDVEDIWLMLSFQQTLQELQQLPAINSMPENKYIKVFNTVKAVLAGFQDKNPDNYSQANEKLKRSPHPLYSTVHSLNDLMEVFA